MSAGTSTIEHALGLKVGDWVEVRSREEILSTLDERGTLDGLPFMPEMVRFCGRRFAVHRAAHKTCDTINDYKARRMTNTVHLAGLRCDGAAHGGCQAGCLLFWREAWLRRVAGPNAAPLKPAAPAAAGVCTPEALERATLAADSGEGDDLRYACQLTDLLKASAPLGSWDVGHFLKDLTSGNISLPVFARGMGIALWNELVRVARSRRAYGRIRGKAVKSTPGEKLDLRPGELVQVRTLAEIELTLNAGQRNRGLWFDIEMLPHIGRTYRVHSRVERILEEKTGRMLTLKGDCIVLEDVVCSGCLSKDRLFCPRGLYLFWREVWLKRVP